MLKIAITVGASMSLSLLAWTVDARESGHDRTKVVMAIESIRGIDFDALDKDGRQKLYDQLDDAWGILVDNPSISRPLLEAALDKESNDSFFIIDMSAAYVTVVGEKPPLDRVATWLSRADPNAFPPQFLMIAAYLSGQRCEACRIVTLKMLEFDMLDGFIPQHALPVDLELGLLFTVGAYGPEIAPYVIDRLDTPNCIVRSNAARAAALIFADASQERIATMAADDRCARARASAWWALGYLSYPDMASLAKEQLVGAFREVEADFIAVIEGLEISYLESSIELLRSLRDAPTPMARAAIEKALEHITGIQPALVESSNNASTGSKRQRKRARRDLHQAVEDWRFESKYDQMELSKALTYEDTPLLNEARLSVLRRLSDECLYEYRTLDAALRTLRRVKLGS